VCVYVRLKNKPWTKKVQKKNFKVEKKPKTKRVRNQVLWMSAARRNVKNLMLVLAACLQTFLFLRWTENLDFFSFYFLSTTVMQPLFIFQSSTYTLQKSAAEREILIILSLSIQVSLSFSSILFFPLFYTILHSHNLTWKKKREVRKFSFLRRKEKTREESNCNVVWIIQIKYIAIQM